MIEVKLNIFYYWFKSLFLANSQQLRRIHRFRLQQLINFRRINPEQIMQQIAISRRRAAKHIRHIGWRHSRSRHGCHGEMRRWWRHHFLWWWHHWRYRRHGRWQHGRTHVLWSDVIVWRHCDVIVNGRDVIDVAWWRDAFGDGGQFGGRVLAAVTHHAVFEREALLADVAFERALAC